MIKQFRKLTISATVTGALMTLASAALPSYRSFKPCAENINSCDEMDPLPRDLAGRYEFTTELESPSENLDQGAAGQGETDESPAEEGSPNQGAADPGATDPGAADQVVPDQGAPDQGVPDQGPLDQGQPDQGEPDQGAQ